MSLETVERESETRLKTLFEDVQSIPVDYGQDSEFAKGESWVRHTVLGGLDITAEIDASSYETSGSIELQVFTKNKRENARIYDLLAAVYRNASFGGVVTLDPLRIFVGYRDGWWQSNLNVDWETTEVTS